jgi:hypothetical protein
VGYKIDRKTAKAPLIRRGYKPMGTPSVKQTDYACETFGRNVASVAAGLGSYQGMTSIVPQDAKMSFAFRRWGSG